MKSHTYGNVGITDVARIIAERAAEAEHEYNVMIGTDSQNFDDTKVVVVIALHDVGHGGIFFYDITHVRRIANVGQKLYYETQLSLKYARKLIEALDEIKDAGGFDYEKLLNFSIHVDAGRNGPSCKVIPEIVGWIHACGYKAVIKPESVAACSIADKYSK